MAASVSRELCTASGTVLRVKLEYIFFSLLEWFVMTETPKQISYVNTSASCATSCAKSQNLPRLIELTVGEDITSYGCGNYGADLFVCTKCCERLSQFEKAKKNVEGIKGRSAVFISH